MSEPYFAAISTCVLVLLTRFQPETSIFSSPPFTLKDKHSNNTLKIWKSKWAIKRKSDEKNPSVYTTGKVTSTLSQGTCESPNTQINFYRRNWFSQRIMFQRKTWDDEIFRLYFIIHPLFKYGTFTVITRINAYCGCLWNENILFL